MTDAAIRPLAGPSAIRLPGLAPPAKDEGPKVFPAFRFIPSASPLLGDIGVLANTYARAAAEAEASRDSRKPADGGPDEPPDEQAKVLQLR